MDHLMLTLKLPCRGNVACRGGAAVLTVLHVQVVSMSTKLAKQQLSQLLHSKDKPVTEELRKTLKKRKQQHKKQHTRKQANKQKQESTYKQNLEYYRSTTTAPKETADLMRKVHYKMS